MATYLLTWNPLWWEWTNLKNDIDEFDKQGYLEYNWSCGSTKKIVPGDRIFLIKLGKEPKGIMASGLATSKVYEGEHWSEDNKIALYVNIRFDTLLDSEQKIFPLSELYKGIYAKTNWTPQSSGRTIPDDIAAQLELDWAKLLKSLSAKKNSKNSNKYWWFGINNIKASDKSSHHVAYTEVEKFLKGEEDEFLWAYGGSAYSKKFYSRMSVGDKIVLWMGHGVLEQWGILGFAYILDIHGIGEETKYCLKRLYIPENPLIPYSKNSPHETENTIFLRDIFGLNFYALKDVFYQLKYVDKRTTPVTIDEITPLQYSALWNRLVKQSDLKYNCNIKYLSVENTLQGLISDENRKKNYLRIFSEAIRYADICGKSKWGVHCKENKIRLLVGNIIVLSIEKESIWLALDKNLAVLHSDKLSLLEQSGLWKWEENYYPIYKQVPSKNGYYLAPDTDVWSEIKHLHLQFVRKVASKFSQLNKRSQMYHSSELLRYIGKELNESIPEPIYEEDSDISVFPDEVPDDDEYYEGATQKVTVNIYERNPEARRKCIDYYGTDCCICGFNFEKKYKDIGKGFIHVHHMKPLSEIGERYELNPVQDLRPVCPNCHAMLHKRKPPYSIEELKQLIS